MENRIVKKNKYNQVIGYIYTDSSGNQTAKDEYFHVLGTYDARSDKTLDAAKRFVCKGNGVGSFFNFI